MGAIPLTSASYQDYLALEAQSDIRYEYHDGFILAMAGGTLEHGQIIMNIGREMGNQLNKSGRPCIVYGSDVKVSIETTRRTFYPDLSVTCEAPEKSDKDPHALTNPVLIIEVLSESTGDFDRGEKFAHYRQIPSLREYVLVNQSQVLVDSFFRLETGSWEIQTRMGLGDKLALKSLGIELQVKDIYHRVAGIDV